MKSIYICLSDKWYGQENNGKKGIFSMGNMQIYCKSRFNNFVRADNGNKIPNTIKPCKNPNSAHFICRHQTNNFIHSKCIHTLFLQCFARITVIFHCLFLQKNFFVPFWNHSLIFCLNYIKLIALVREHRHI